MSRADDPLRQYRRALACLDCGDEVAARRAVEEGLARAWSPASAPVRACLDDLGAQLDGDAALRRFAARTPGPRAWMAHPDRLARDILRLRRAHLVEVVVEEISAVLPPPVMGRLVAHLDDARTQGCRDLLAAIAAVSPAPVAGSARRAWGGGRPESPAARALAFPRLAAAWRCAAGDAAPEHQLIVAVARDGGRVAPMVAVVRHDHPSPLLRDAFFLPDMVPGRLDREVIAPLVRAGITAVPVDVADALHAACGALDAALSTGWRIPSEAHQSVIARIGRLRAACGGPCGHAGPGPAPAVG